MEDKVVNLIEEDMQVTLTLEDDSVVRCMAVCKCFVQGECYIVLLPLMEDGMQDPDGDVLFYGFKEENGEPVLSLIEDDDTYIRVTEVFDEWLDKRESWFDTLEDE